MGCRTAYVSRRTDQTRSEEPKPTISSSKWHNRPKSANSLQILKDQNFFCHVPIIPINVILSDQLL